MIYTMLHSRLRDSNGNTVATMERCDGGRLVETPNGTIRTVEMGRNWSATIDGELIAKAHPLYAEGEDPSVAGWPINRPPRTDRASVSFHGKSYELKMEKNSSYRLSDEGGTVVEVHHRGLGGGWTIASRLDVAGTVLTYVFCRALEKENEMPIV